ncbi:hypothetical protein Zmor_009070, partial [Zophobas morio]
MRESGQGVSGLDLSEAKQLLSFHTNEFELFLKNHYESFTEHANAVERVHKSLDSLYNELWGARKTGEVSKAAFGGIVNALSSVDGLKVPVDSIEDLHGLMKNLADR